MEYCCVHHILRINIHYVNGQVTNYGIRVKLPCITFIQTTHKSVLSMPNLLLVALSAHTLKGFKTFPSFPPETFVIMTMKHISPKITSPFLAEPKYFYKSLKAWSPNFVKFHCNKRQVNQSNTLHFTKDRANQCIILQEMSMN